MTKDEALRMALEALEMYELETNSEFQRKAIAAIKKVLAQPEPPLECKTEAEKTAFAFGWWKALETKREWVGLTDEEIKALASWWPSYDQMPALMTLARDIENSLKEKNT